MKVIAINGGPRKGWNTSKTLERALDGAKSAGAEAGPVINLYDLKFKGCVSCFRCKLKTGGHPGRCAMQDDLSEVLERVLDADALLLASPIYLWDVTGVMRMFLERLVFSNIGYRTEDRSDFKGSLNVGFIYTMNVPRDAMEECGYDFIYKSHALFLSLLNGKVDYITVNDTYQFDDYSKYDAPLFDPAHKARVREAQFPKDLERAFELGVNVVPSRRL